MKTFVRAVVTGFALSLGAALFKKVAKQVGLDDKPDADDRDAGELGGHVPQLLVHQRHGTHPALAVFQGIAQARVVQAVGLQPQQHAGGQLPRGGARGQQQQHGQDQLPGGGDMAPSAELGGNFTDVHCLALGP